MQDSIQGTQEMTVAAPTITPTEPAMVCFGVMMDTYSKTLSAKDMEVNKVALVQMMDVWIRARELSEQLVAESSKGQTQYTVSGQERERLLEAWYFMANHAKISYSQRHVFLSAYMEVIDKIHTRKVDIGTIPKATIAMIVETAKDHGYLKPKWWQLSYWV